MKNLLSISIVAMTILSLFGCKETQANAPALGVGIVPCRQILDQLMNTGYDGWFCIEGYGAKDMKEHLKISVENMTK